MSIFCGEQPFRGNGNGSAGNKCIFNGVSSCRDFVGEDICNQHLAMFSLTNQVVYHMNADNDVTTKIVLYHTAPGNLKVPLFSTSEHKIIMEDIRNFVRNVCTSFPGINMAALETRIAKYMGMSAVYTQANCRTGWLDDSSVRLIIRNPVTNAPRYLSRIPYLHKVLFAHAEASNIINRTSGNQIYLIPHVSLVANDMNNSFTFQVINKKNLLRFTDHPNGVATPIVLDAFKFISQSNDDIVISPLANMQDNCYL